MKMAVVMLSFVVVSWGCKGPTAPSKSEIMVLEVSSRGAAQPLSSTFFFGAVGFFRTLGKNSRETLLFKEGGGGGARGYNIIGLSPDTGEITYPWKTLDTWIYSSANVVLEEYLNTITPGTIVLVGVADTTTLQESGTRALEALGSKMIRQYQFRNSWAMIAIKGQGSALREGLSAVDAVTLSATFTVVRED